MIAFDKLDTRKMNFKTCVWTMRADTSFHSSLLGLALFRLRRKS